MTIVEVYADVACPFTHVGLRRFVERREAAGRSDAMLVVRAWPLEVVNGHPMDPAFIAEEVDEIREQVAPDLFTGFSADAFPATSLPAMALAAAAYALDVATGERVSLALRTLLFEDGADIADAAVLDALAAEHAAGVERGVIGSPHFFTTGGGFFCPALDIHRDDAGELVITADPEAFDAFLAAALA